MCDCINVKCQTYDNQVKLVAPVWSSKDYICVDTCLMNEILVLWNRGIITTGCCCGHNYLEPYIGVTDEFIPLMKELGYKVHFNHMRPGDEDTFVPNTKL